MIKSVIQKSVYRKYVGTYILFIGIVCLIGSCSTSRDRDIPQNSLSQLKEESEKMLVRNVDEFNNYQDRPSSDGYYDQGNNKEFLLQNIPLFISSDTLLTRVYNYRWWMMSKHLKEYIDPIDQKNYWVVTEFFGVKPWASRSGAIPCPAGHQFYDLRWLKDPKFLMSYADYFMRGSASKLDQRENESFLTYLSRPESHHYSSWMIDGIEAFLKVHPDRSWLYEILPSLEKHQEVWDSLFTVQNETAETNGMYKIQDLYDGMEFSLSAVLALIESGGAYELYTHDNWRNYYLGWETTEKAARSSYAQHYPKAFRNGYPDYYLVRPSVNSYAYANLRSLSNLYRLYNGNEDKVAYYADKSSLLRDKMLRLLWNQEDQFFYSYSAGDNAYGTGGFESRVRESVGYTPWYFNMIPVGKNRLYETAWEWFSSTKGFYNTKGMTTAERQHPYYNEQAYAWNGRGWPFQNSVVYKAYANYLRNYKEKITPADRELLYDYIQKLAGMHGMDQVNIGEWYIPSDGKEFGGEKDYFHSTFPDILIEDLLGFKAYHEEKFSIHPLLPEGKWDYFYLGNLLYHGQVIDIAWNKDWDTTRPGNQQMLCVWVNGKLVANSTKLNDELLIVLE